MAGVVNLRLARKRRKRAKESAIAETNRLLHSEPAAARKKTKLGRELAAKRLDGHRRGTPPPARDD